MNGGSEMNERRSMKRYKYESLIHDVVWALILLTAVLGGMLVLWG